jgi:hypothetical protein
VTPEELAAERGRWRTLPDDVRAHVVSLARRPDPVPALLCVQNLGLEMAARHIADLRQVIDPAEQPSMTGERFREIVASLGWSFGDVARSLERDSREIRRWAAGKNPIDPDAAAWLEVQAANPPPRRSRHE